MKNLVKKLNMKLIVLFSVAICVVLVLAGVFRNSVAVPEAIAQISFSSQELKYSNKEPGSIEVEEKAEWIEKNQAKITWNINTVKKSTAQPVDTILVLDTSNSMNTESFQQVKQDTKKLIHDLLDSSSNQISLITFNSNAQIASDFTNDIGILENAIDSMSTSGDTNYYQAFVNVETLLNNYQKEENRDCVILFVTDGYPSLDTPNEMDQYIHLKNTYPYVKINAIQYEMGKEILEPIQKVSDYQFSADKKSLYNVLVNSYSLSDPYEKFIMTIVINNEYFQIESISSIHSSIGEVELREENGEQQVVWTIENLSSGSNPILEIDTKLKEDYQSVDGYYPTTKNVNLIYKMKTTEEKIINSQSPILKNYYEVQYDTNMPSGCVVNNVPSNTREMVYNTVEISNIKPSCGDYQFLGWKLLDEDIKQINEDYFKMPEHDVVLRAEWGKTSLAVSMNGKVYTELPRNEKTAQEAINEMKMGWNLGNTLDTTNYQKTYLGEERAVTFYETAWGNPVTTKEMIDEVKKAGFNSVRIPVTYYDHIDENGKIDAYWLNRVKEVIGYVLENDMYCIMNIHHDTGFYEGGAWIVADADKYQENAEKLEKLWTELATEFKDYDYKLVFEGFNEIIDSNRSINWKEGNEDTINVNRLNQVFVDTVRKTGGKNKDRFLIVSTYTHATYLHLLQTFEMPADTVEDKIILALHSYHSTESDIDTMMTNIKIYCRDKNIPVIIDEFGTKEEDYTEEERIRIASYYVSNARKIGITCFWWDNGKSTGYQLLDRNHLTWLYPEIVNALMENS